MSSLTPPFWASFTSFGSSARPTVRYVETVLTFLPALFCSDGSVFAG